MKTLRQFSAAATLSLMLAVSVLAGQIESNGATATPPPPPQTTSTVTAIVLAVLSVVYP